MAAIRHNDHQRHVELLRTLHRVIEMITDLDEVESALDLITAEIYQRFRFTSVAIGVRDGDWLDFRYLSSSLDAKGGRNPISRGVCGRAVRTCTGQLVQDVTHDPDYIHYGGPVAKEICVPIVVDSAVFGVLNVEANAEEPLGDEEFDVLTTLARSLGLAIERSRQRALERRRLRTLASLQRLTGRIAGRIDVTDSVGDILAEISQVLDVPSVTFGMLRGQDLHFYAAYDHAMPNRVPIFAHGVDSGVTGLVARTGQPVFLRDASSHPEYVDHNPNIRQEICVPVRVGDQVLGVLDFEMDERREFDDSDLDIALLLADQFATALSNQWRVEAVERRNQQLRTVARATEILTGTAHVREVLPDVLKAVADGFAFASCGIALIDGDRLQFVAVEHALSGDTSHFREFGVPLDAGVTGRVARTGQPAVILDVRSDPDYLVTSEEVQYEICVPIKAEGRVLGVVNVESPASRPLDDSDAEILTIVADHIGAGLTRSDLYLAELRSRRELEALQHVATIVASTLDSQEALRRIVDTLARVFEYPAVSFRLLQGDELVVAAVHGATAEGTGKPIPLGKGVIGRVAQTGKAAYVPDVSQEPAYIRSREEFTSEVCVPVFVDGELAGVLNLEGTADRPVTERDLELMQTFAEQAGVVLQNARLYERMHQLATHDPITGLPNHRVFRERLHAEVRRAERYNRELALLLIDLDDFKAINDAFGHPAGDSVLRELAVRLRSVLRDTDLLARYAGDEFVALLPESTAEHARSTALRLRQAIEREPFSVPAPVEVSIGCACFPADARTEDELVDAADQAMYRDKRARDQRRARP